MPYPDPPLAPFRLRLHINWLQSGWSEVYPLRATTIDQALLDAQQICLGRVAWLGSGPSLDYASVSSYQSPRDSFAVTVLYPTYALPSSSLSGAPQHPPAIADPGPPNDRGSGFLYDFENDAGQWGSRLFRCVPDAWVSAMTAQVTPPVPTYAAGLAAMLPGPPANGLQAVLGSFLDLLINKTGFVVVTPVPPASKLLSIAPIARATFERISTRKVGRPFGRTRGRARKSI